MGRLRHTALVVCVTGLWLSAGDARGSAKSAATQLGATASPAHGDLDPEELTRAQWDAVMAVLRNDRLDQKAQGDAIEKIASSVIDFPLMAKLALGRTHWRTFTPPQRKQYIALFVDRLKSSYRKRIAGYKGEQVRFKPRLPNGAPADKGAPAKRGDAKKTRPTRTVHVPIELVSKDKTVTILHKFRKVGKTWTIYDIEIEGVSILLTYRSQFDDILRRGTAEDLLARLRQKPSD